MCRWGARTASECQKQLPSPAAQPHFNCSACQRASFQGVCSMRTAARSWRGSVDSHVPRCSARQNS
eukprot:6490793-Amphidinium_carterae.6